MASSRWSGFLVEKGADISIASNNGFTPANATAGNGQRSRSQRDRCRHGDAQQQRMGNNTHLVDKGLH
ncbi:hypothetical protein VDGL01_12561 [Verticillium dahliae]